MATIGFEQVADFGIERNFGQRNQLQRFYGNFQAELGKLLLSLTDTSSPLELGGKTFSKEEKFGVAATMWQELWRNEQETAYNLLLENFKFDLLTLPNKLNNVVNSG
ncbi:hypothetical protein HZB07_01900 [Candidatus Saganbacteria bacterium]|nr:hypothetical protein [Candidatus Saganbacteria bacterium]